MVGFMSSIIIKRLRHSLSRLNPDIRRGLLLLVKFCSPFGFQNFKPVTKKPLRETRSGLGVALILYFRQFNLVF
jgi:hypothetical protein